MAKRTATESIRHKDKRANIPTHELSDFVADTGDVAPAIYRRDASLDPQLVWRGKTEQSDDMDVPLVPLFIQEKIHSQAIIEGLRDSTGDPPLELFSDFNGIEFEELVEFYQHEQNWSNRLILGDSLLVMSSLSEKEGLKSKIQTIYIDPPYGINFGSNWQVSTKNRDVQDTRNQDVSRQPEQVKAFRDTWTMGIHSYLHYLRDRLLVAHELLADSGSIFVQIGGDNVHLVRCLLDEVFRPENHIETIAFRTKNMTLGGTYLEGVFDFILWYGKDSKQTKFRRLYQKTDTAGDSHWNRYMMPDGTRHTMTKEEVNNPALLPRNAQIYQLMGLYPAGPFATGIYTFSYQGKDYTPPPARSWKSPIEGMRRLAAAGRLEPYSGGSTLRYVLKLDDYPVSPIHNIWANTAPPSDKTYMVQTNTRVVERCLLMTSDPGDIVLDPTCGSGTTAYVAEQWGRRWITIDTSRVALALARTRLMSALYPYYLLLDSKEGRLKENAVTGATSDSQADKFENDIRKGFVYRRAPHIQAKFISNNSEIDTIVTRFEPVLGGLLDTLNSELGQKWAEWEVPRQSEKGWSQQAINALESWWPTLLERQAQIDESIKRNSESEILFDQPFEDPKRVRVTGPFTVESLGSPHRILPADQDEEDHKVSTAENSSSFLQMILDNMRKAGIQNTRREERLVFDQLEPYATASIQAAGEYLDAQGDRKRVAVSIGPEHGTVGKELIKDAAKEALKGTGFDLLLICAFAFDGNASETAREFTHTADQGFAVTGETKLGKLPVLLVRMNPDLAMGEELLKKTKSGNLFMVFGEPDIKIHKDKGMTQVEIFGLDIYDPTTGEVRNSKGTSDIACWFIDTNYNQESFFVRQAYFTGDKDPYDKLRKVLRADVDESAWATLNTTKSRPFPVPKTGRIAVKVINHYGDEVLKVYKV